MTTLNRFFSFRPQGVAYHQLKIDEHAEVYPMVCSTAAKSVTKLINATSFAESLQFLCMKVISKDRKRIDVSQSIYVPPLIFVYLTIRSCATTRF